MVKKRLADGSECRKCQDATEHLRARGVWDRVDRVVWAIEDDAASPGWALAQRFGVDRAPFFVVEDERGATAYESVLQLVRERFDGFSDAQLAQTIDPDDVGGI